LFGQEFSLRCFVMGTCQRNLLGHLLDWIQDVAG
jgi:hypothetical protein